MKQVDLEWDKLTQIKTSGLRMRQVNSELDKLIQNEKSWPRMRQVNPKFTTNSEGNKLI